MTTEENAEFVHRLGKLAKQWGIGETAGKIWGALLLNGSPLTQKEIAQKCDYSLGLISRNLNILLKFNMVTYSGRKGQEKLYKPVISFIDSFEKLLVNMVENEMDPLIDLLTRMIRKEEDKKEKMRLKELLNDHKKMRVLFMFFIQSLDVRKKVNIPHLKDATRESLNRLDELIKSFSIIENERRISKHLYKEVAG